MQRAILARKLKEDFVQKIERELEGRFGLTVNREKTKVVDLVKKGVSLEFLGYEFRYVRGILHTWYGTEDKWLWFGPSMKSVKKVRAKVKELTLGRMNRIPIRDTIQKLNVILKDPARFGIRVTSAAPKRKDRVFAVNELDYEYL